MSHRSLNALTVEVIEHIMFHYRSGFYFFNSGRIHTFIRLHCFCATIKIINLPVLLIGITHIIYCTYIMLL